MGRIRTIKPEIYADSKTGMLSDRAYRVFTGLLNFADDYGVVEFEPNELKAKILPYCQESSIDCIARPILDECSTSALVVFFSHDDRKYLLIKNFNKHQRIDRPSKPLIDGWIEKKIFETVTYETTQGALVECSASTRRALSAVLDSKGEDSKEEELRAETTVSLSADFREWVGVTELIKKTWQEAYPAVDINLELKKMACYMAANPNKRKKNWLRFITNWLNRVQERGGSKGINGQLFPQKETPKRYRHPVTGEVIEK